MGEHECAGFIFYSNFDSANLDRVDLVPPNESIVTPACNADRSTSPELPDYEFNVWIKADSSTTGFQVGYRTWFHFGIKGPLPSLLVKFNIIGLNRIQVLFNEGMAPVYKIIPGKANWDRIRTMPVYNILENYRSISFKFKMPENTESISYFAFTYPFSYAELQHMLCKIDTRFSAIEHPDSKDDIYYTRECVCWSLEERRVDLITISSHHGLSKEREVRLKHLFPDKTVRRPFRFIDKKVIFISARVHPGETPSTFVFNGLLNLLLNREDPIAIILRRLYVFKMIPFLNPDGVARGHYRADTRGVNLNRVYLNPSLSLHPSIFAARSLIRYYHFGFEKPDKINPAESSSGTEKQSDNKLSKKVSHMTIEENKKNEKVSSWCMKCKLNTIDYQETVPDLSNVIRTFNQSDSLGKDFCQNCGGPISESSDDAYTHGDSSTNESGLFLYIDMHGHVATRGIFMFGNHFQDEEHNVECMLLPKVMSINNYNFHFTACNFTETNMYRRDRGGQSREGCGRVAVTKLTGLFRSYTLECNYNTGRFVNVLPPTIKETLSKGVHTLPVPPKYSPQVFEEVGKAIGASILDLTGHNPFTRIPNSEFHTLNGIRDWLRTQHFKKMGETRTSNRLQLRKTASLHAQGKPVRAVILKNRVTSSKLPKKRPPTKAGRTKSKENIFDDSLISQPSCSKTISHRIRPKPTCVRPKLKKESSTKLKRDSSTKLKSNMSQEKLPRPSVDHVTRNMQNTNYLVKQRLKTELTSKLKNMKAKEPALNPKPSSARNEPGLKLHEICFIKDAEGKKVIAKYKTGDDTKEQMCDDDLIVSWDANSSNPQVFSQKSKLLTAPASPTTSPKATNQAGPSKRGAFRVHNFAKTTSFSKSKRNKRPLRRLTASAEVPGKDKVHKRKKINN